MTDEPKPLTDVEVEEWEKISLVSTPGPWVSKPRLVAGREVDCEIVGNEKPRWHTNTPVCKLSTGFIWYEGDKKFIAHTNPAFASRAIARIRADGRRIVRMRDTLAGVIRILEDGTCSNECAKHIRDHCLAALEDGHE